MIPVENWKKEQGVGSLERHSAYFLMIFLLSNTAGREDKVPCIRPDMTRKHWMAIARMIIYLLKWKVDYFPMGLLQAFLISTLFGDENLSDDLLIKSFKSYVSLEEKDLINSLNDDNFDKIKDGLIEMLSEYNNHKNLTCENFKEVLTETAHVEIVQKPRYISNCFQDLFCKFPMKPLNSAADLLKFYEIRVPTAKKVIKCLNVNKKDDNEENFFKYLTKYIKSLSKDELSLFLRFITGGDLLPDIIEVEFSHREPRAPRARTCTSLLSISPTYSCFNELAEEFGHVLKSPETFVFSFV